MGKETIAAADNIGANISQAVGCQYIAGYQHGLRMARASVFATRHWLRRAYYRNLVTDRQAARIRRNLEDILQHLENGLETYKHHPENALLASPYEVDQVMHIQQAKTNGVNSKNGNRHGNGNHNGNRQVGLIEANYYDRDND
jgi:four helix bundle protein